MKSLAWLKRSAFRPGSPSGDPRSGGDPNTRLRADANASPPQGNPYLARATLPSSHTGPSDS
jgi:hypothetical protein